jgi:aerotaxis receptor
MEDMDPAHIMGDYREHTLTYHDGSQRRVLVTGIETPYPDGRLIVSRTDLAGHITHANESFVEMSGYRREELIHQPHHILRHPEMPAAAFKDLWDTVERGEKWHGYVKNLRKDGGFYWVYATVIPNIRQGRTVGFTSVRRKPSRRKVEEAMALYRTLV